MDVAGSPAFRCSGTLIAPKLVLTAGHCAGEPGEFSGMRVFTESDVQNGNNNYPFAGPNTIEAKAWHSHPQFAAGTGGVFRLDRADVLAFVSQDLNSLRCNRASRARGSARAASWSWGGSARRAGPPRAAPPAPR